LGARDLLGAQAQQVPGEDLAVDERKAPAVEEAAEVHKGHLGSVVDAGEHGFTEEDSADGDAIQPAGECVILPDFDGSGDMSHIK